MSGNRYTAHPGVVAKCSRCDKEVSVVIGKSGPFLQHCPACGAIIYAGLNSDGVAYVVPGQLGIGEDNSALDEDTPWFVSPKWDEDGSELDILRATQDEETTGTWYPSPGTVDAVRRAAEALLQQSEHAELGQAMQDIAEALALVQCPYATLDDDEPPFGVTDDSRDVDLDVWGEVLE